MTNSEDKFIKTIQQKKKKDDMNAQNICHWINHYLKLNTTCIRHCLSYFSFIAAIPTTPI